MLNDQFEKTSYLSGDSAGYIDDLYETYLQDPNKVPDHWKNYFSSIQTDKKEFSHEAIREQLIAQSQSASPLQSPSQPPQKQSAVDALITAYRRYGHLNAKIDPLNAEIISDVRLTLAHYGLSDADLNENFDARQLFLNNGAATLEKIITTLKTLYCGSIGIEYTRLINEDERDWLRDYIENKIPALQFSAEQEKQILEKLTQAEGMEKYLDTKYPGQKRFSIEGADALIPILDVLSFDARKKNVRELVIGMAHRGRLNVLLNIMGKSPTDLFQEFDGTKDYGDVTGDVKYHKGYSCDVETPDGPIHISLGFNPSHLEFINTVVMGSVRARQERSTEIPKKDYALAVLVHGDAAFAGQGIVMETLAMSQTRAYNIGGTIHIITNNQVGFTTSNPQDARSSRYCSDIAKMIDAPILHVNGDDAEACIRVMKLALDYRMRFHKDVVIDLVCYRMHGHNEADDPTCTQPLMYQIIHAKKTPRAIYADFLISQNIISVAEADQFVSNYRDGLDAGHVVLKLLKNGLAEKYAENWAAFLNTGWEIKANTGVPSDVLEFLGKRITSIPEGFTLQRQVAMIMQARVKMMAGEQPLDWGCAETLAYAALLYENHPVRFTGEDVRRGTFFHRHAALFDQKTGECYMPLLHIDPKQAPMQIYDSLLSEMGALGFEYGYSSADPNSLVMWEAQFGDFVNVAQVIIDQFISSAWQKWNRLSGLVMLLPHGSEGQGPEHSSARLERFLQLCAQENMQVCVPSTPAQIFHLLRRQALRQYRKPLIVMSPKSLLRHKSAVSNLDELIQGEFQCVISEVDTMDADKVTRLVLCSGKIYYELLAKRREEKIDTIAIVRIEQLYPFPDNQLKSEMNKYANLKEIVWCQEEPKNQGAWYSSRHRILRCIPENGHRLFYAGRRAMAAPAAGYPALHNKQQADLINQALGFVPLVESR
ncbi:MAG: 2-oxoglutarate dehydrogenase E1 component [Gammaproteobacteria bacterium RIFCSPHIGHO2_12_FULL_38_11]|nr:MAG: 2-oxoglutarate dehydrogenase E1 component [Gammaproteobacteria bacterium RIFCSPHIGHO2_12_FULL_38_11]